MYQFTVPTLKIRLDKFLVEQLPEFSRAQIQKSIEAGGVTVNGVARNEPKFVVREGDRVEYSQLQIADFRLKIENSKKTIKVLYDNHGLLIIDKPPGLSVHPGAGVKDGSLSEQLLEQFPELIGVGEAHRPGIVHRLDKDTSGVMLVAKTAEMYEYLKDAFATRKIKKRYLALILGVPDKAHGFIDSPIGKSKTDFRKHTTKDMVEPKPSLTEYRVLEVLTLKTQDSRLPRPGTGGQARLTTGLIDKTALISVDLHTGRTHQIRVHMASIGHPLIGDSLYGHSKRGGGKKTTLSVLKRQFLHAKSIEVQLPDGTWIEAVSELANDLRGILVGLESRIAYTL